MYEYRYFSVSGLMCGAGIELTVFDIGGTSARAYLLNDHSSRLEHGFLENIAQRICQGIFLVRF